jgi:hypothetical protein
MHYAVKFTKNMSLEGSPTTNVPIPRARKATAKGEHFIVSTIGLVVMGVNELLFRWKEFISVGVLPEMRFLLFYQ